jgi:hypothetical protein
MYQALAFMVLLFVKRKVRVKLCFYIFFATFLEKVAQKSAFRDSLLPSQHDCFQGGSQRSRSRPEVHLLMRFENRS